MTNFEEYEKIDISSSDEDLNVTKIDIAAAISSLAPEERQVIVMRYYKDMTQTQVAKALGIICGAGMQDRKKGAEMHGGGYRIRLPQNTAKIRLFRKICKFLLLI